MSIATLERSDQIRKEQAKPTGEAEMARGFTKQFLEMKVSLSKKWEFEGVRGVVNAISPVSGLLTTSNALYHYDGKFMSITSCIGGDLKIVRLLGRKDKSGLHAKFSVLESRLQPNQDAYQYLMR
jgi:hypothetical protein